MDFFTKWTPGKNNLFSGYFGRASGHEPLVLRDQMFEEGSGPRGRRHRVHAHREEGARPRMQTSFHLPPILLISN